MDKHNSLTKRTFKTISDKVDRKHENLILEKINDNYCLRLVVLLGEYKWHYHNSMDELFIILEGQLKIEFKDTDSVYLKEGDFIKIPAKTIHRTSAVVRTVNLLFEKEIDDTIFVD